MRSQLCPSSDASAITPPIQCTPSTPTNPATRRPLHRKRPYPPRIRGPIDVIRDILDYAASVKEALNTVTESAPTRPAPRIRHFFANPVGGSAIVELADENVYALPLREVVATDVELPTERRSGDGPGRGLPEHSGLRCAKHRRSEDTSRSGSALIGFAHSNDHSQLCSSPIERHSPDPGECYRSGVGLLA